jgi:hypothetical protein
MIKCIHGDGGVYEYSDGNCENDDHSDGVNDNAYTAYTPHGPWCQR